MPARPASTISSLDAYTDDLRTLHLAQRDTLPHAANGKTIVPSDPYAAQVDRDIRAGKSREIHRLLAVGITNLRDGAPLAAVVARPLREIAIYQVEAREYQPRPMIALVRRETREQALLDLAQLRAIHAGDNDLDAKRELASSIRAYRAILDEMEWENDRQIALQVGGHTIDPIDPSPNSPFPKRGSLIRIK